MYKTKRKRKFGVIRWILSVMLLVELILSFYINFQTFHHREYKEQLSLGDKYLKELDYENAEICYRNAINIDNKKVEPYIKIADTSIMQGDYEKARDILLEAQNAISVTSEAKQNLIEKRQEDLNLEYFSKVENKDGAELNDIEENQDISVHEVAEEVLGYTYIGENEYELSLIRDLDRSSGYWTPKTELVEQKGYFSAKMHDFDNDGEEEIFVITLENNRDEHRQYFLLHMLEKEGSDSWKETATMEVPGYGTEAREVSGLLTNASQRERIDFFLRENQNGATDIFVEIYMKADYFVNGETWELADVQYTNEGFQLTDSPLTIAGSSISAELTLDINNSEYPSDESSSAENFINRFMAIGLKAPTYLGFYTPLVYEDSSLVYLGGCRKTSTITQAKAFEWQKGSEERLPGIKLTLRDYTKPETEVYGAAGALYTKYIQENKPDAWYVIVDMDGIPALVIADSRRSGLSTRREWCSYADNAEIFLIAQESKRNQGSIESLGHTAGYEDAAIYYAENKITVMSENENISYKESNNKLVQEKSDFWFDYVYDLEFHRDR